MGKFNCLFDMAKVQSGELGGGGEEIMPTATGKEK